MKPIDTKNPHYRGGSRCFRCFEHLGSIIQAKTRFCKRAISYKYLSLYECLNIPIPLKNSIITFI